MVVYVQKLLFDILLYYFILLQDFLPVDYPGKPKNIDPNDPIVNSLLSDNIERFSVNDNSVELVSIQQVTKQVVAGLKYTVKLIAMINGESKPCKFTIWSRVWLEDPNQKHIFSCSCDGEDLSVSPLAASDVPA